MLTQEEVRDTLTESLQLQPEDLQRLVADYIPQDVIDQLVLELTRVHIEQEGAPPEVVPRLVAYEMTAFQMGWCLAQRAITGSLGKELTDMSDFNLDLEI